MQNLKTKVAVVGCGYWGKNLVRIYSDLGNLKYVCDKNYEVGEDVAKKFNTISLDLEKILKSDVDAIVISTPAETHYNLASAALSENKNVFRWH